LATERREKFQTGGGPPRAERPSTTADAVRSIIDQQMPLEGIDDDDHLDSGTFYISCTHILCIVVNYFFHIAGEEKEEERTKKERKSSKKRPGEQFVEEYHKAKMEALRKEHEMKMKILEKELALKELEIELRISESNVAIDTLNCLKLKYLDSDMGDQ